MKIKIITCHDVYNAGASLQAYALLTYLTQLGHDVEIIDYKPDYLSGHYSFTMVNPAYDRPVVKQLYLLLKLPGRIKRFLGIRKSRFDSFKQNFLRISAVKYKSNEELKKNPPEADIVFAGSDQIWNPLFQNGRDPAFYLDFATKNSIKASYAASFAVDKIPWEYINQIERYLKKFDYVSVRETSAIKILDTLNIQKGYCVCDPVFLLERKEWEKLTFPVSEEDYLFVYDFDNNNDIKNLAQKVAYEKKLKIYSFFSVDYADKCFDKEGPLGFLSLIKNAKFVLSNSFHATAFSIIFERPFAVVNRREEINTRMRDLLDIFHLEATTEQFDRIFLDRYMSAYVEQSKQYIELVLNDKRLK